MNRLCHRGELYVLTLIISRVDATNLSRTVRAFSLFTANCLVYFIRLLSITLLALYLLYHVTLLLPLLYTVLLYICVVCASLHSFVCNWMRHRDAKKESRANSTVKERNCKFRMC